MNSDTVSTDPEPRRINGSASSRSFPFAESSGVPRNAGGDNGTGTNFPS